MFLVLFFDNVFIQTLNFVYLEICIEDKNDSIYYVFKKVRIFEFATIASIMFYMLGIWAIVSHTP